jgi:hypothetical protein
MIDALTTAPIFPVAALAVAMVTAALLRAGLRHLTRKVRRA